MAKPATADIEAVYARGEAAGMTRDDIDQIALPHIHRLGGALGLMDVVSHRELRAINDVICEQIAQREAAERAKRGPAPTPRQIDYAVALGADPTEVAAMTRHEASALIDQLKRSNSATQTAFANGRRHGVNGQIWDNA